MQGQWIQRPQQNKTVIFVHGILSSSESCWTYKKGVFWFKKRVAWFNLLKDEEELKGLGIYTFSYNTGIFSGTYSLNDVVTAFKEQLKLDKVLQPNKQLIFVCHSMGGIVVRKFIVERQTELINLNLEIGLFLVASPSLGSGYANILRKFAEIFNHTQANALRFSQMNIWLNGLDTEFMNFKEAKHLPLIGKELIEDKFIVKKLFFIPQIVKPFSGARYFGEHFKVANSDHSSIAKPENKQAIQHRLLCDFIKDFQKSTKKDYIVNSSNLVLINTIKNNNSIEIMLKNIGADSALIYEAEFILKDVHISRGTCSYLPATEYQLFITLFEKNYQFIENIESIKSQTSQLINSGDVDRIKFSFNINKDPCVYIDFEGIFQIKYDTSKILNIDNIVISF